MTPLTSLVPAERIEKRIVLLRGHKVMLSTDLANLYDVETRALVQAVKRNRERFPEDFMFQLTWEEVSLLRSQSVILKEPASSGSRSQSVTLKRGQNVKYAPYAFTEQGVAMLSSVLRSRRAAQVNIEIMSVSVNQHVSERENAQEQRQYSSCCPSSRGDDRHRPWRTRNTGPRSRTAL